LGLIDIAMQCFSLLLLVLFCAEVRNDGGLLLLAFIGDSKILLYDVTL